MRLSSKFFADEFAVAPPQAHEEVRDFFYAHHNHIALLDELAEGICKELIAAPVTRAGRTKRVEALGGELHDSRDLVARIELRLARNHRITTVSAKSGGATDVPLRSFDPSTLTLTVADVDPGQRAERPWEPYGSA